MFSLAWSPCQQHQLYRAAGNQHWQQDKLCEPPWHHPDVGTPSQGTQPHSNHTPLPGLCISHCNTSPRDQLYLNLPLCHLHTLPGWFLTPAPVWDRALGTTCQCSPEIKQCQVTAHFIPSDSSDTHSLWAEMLLLTKLPVDILGDGKTFKCPSNLFK